MNEKNFLLTVLAVSVTGLLAMGCAAKNGPSCKVSYTNSDGNTNELCYDNMNALRRKAFKEDCDKSFGGDFQTGGCDLNNQVSGHCVAQTDPDVVSSGKKYKVALMFGGAYTKDGAKAACDNASGDWR